MRDNYTCQNCGTKEDIEIHHIVPLANGGRDVPSNVVTLCTECHKAAHGDIALARQRKEDAHKIHKEASEGKVICHACHNEYSADKRRCGKCHSTESSKVLEY